MPTIITGVDGIGPKRNARVNTSWGGVIDSNDFGTEEYMDFLDQIGADAYVSVNLARAPSRKPPTGRNT